MATAEQDHSYTPIGTILATIISIVSLIRNFHVRRLYKRDHANQNTRPSYPALPHVASTNTVLPPTTKEGRSDRANSSALAYHGRDHITEKADGNQNELPPILLAPAIPPTPCSPFPGSGNGHWPYIRNVAEPSVLRVPAVSTKLYLPLAHGHPFPSESKPCLPSRPNTSNTEHGQPLHTTTALQITNSSDVSREALSSRTKDLSVEPTQHPTIGAEEAPVVPRETPQMITSASTVTASSGTSTADNLLLLPSSNQKIRERKPPAPRRSIVLDAPPDFMELLRGRLPPDTDNDAKAPERTLLRAKL